MSAIGLKRTSLVAPHMSAFGGKADIAVRRTNVRFIAQMEDICFKFRFVQRSILQQPLARQQGLKLPLSFGDQGGRT
jgi:hypothetical protein